MNGGRDVSVSIARSGLALLLLAVSTIVSGCMSTSYPLQVRSAALAHYSNGQVVYTSIKKDSIVELIVGKVKDAMVAKVFVQNLSRNSIDFGPDDVRVVLEYDSNSKTKEGNPVFRNISIKGGIDPDTWSQSFADFYRSPVQSTGGFGARLSGATIGEAIVAENQLYAEVATVRERTAKSADTMRKELTGITSLRQGDSLSAVIGMGYPIVFQQIDDGNGEYGFRVSLADGSRAIADIGDDQSARDFFGRFDTDASSVVFTSLTNTTKRIAPFEDQFTGVNFPQSYSAFVRVGNEIHVFELSVGQKH